jgi:N-acetylmuramoyl-L-alanine amidase
MIEPVRAITLLLAGALLCAPTAVARGQDDPGSPLILIEPSGRRAVPTQMVGGLEMIALDEIGTIFDLTVREDALAGGVTIAANDQIIAMSAGQSLVSVGGRIVALPGPMTSVAGQWFVPIEFLSRALAPVANVLIDLRPTSRLLIVGDVTVPRVTARIDNAGPPTRVTLKIAPAVRVASTVEAGRIVVRIEADGVDLDGGTIPGAGLINGIRSADPASIIVTFSADAAAPMITPTVVDGAARVIIDVPASAAATPAPPPSVPVAANGTIVLNPAATLDIIVIDPGHGGDDVGVRGSGGGRESQITLAIAEQLRTLIETRLGARVLLTRDSDRTVLLDQRTAIANNNKADLFLSLHAGGAPSEAVAGAEVLHVRLGREGENARQRAVTAATLPVLGGGSRAIEAIRWDLAQAPHVDTSATLAGILVEELARRVPMGSRPSRDVPLRLLMGTNMPAAMIEIGYLTNPEQEQLLLSRAYQATVAEALYDAIVRFRGYLDARGAQ